ncbi:hypothetical protein [Kitasatospora azatica]|uniref:hypothetical protein n=1 Tax=Kitasatospora azatica TaxID=58347 RepID=UPI00055C0D8D|nr:hypothetical protein [Kitasatospora azatica]
MSPLKVTDGYLTKLADNGIKDLVKSMTGINPNDANGKAIGHVMDFAAGGGGLPSIDGNYTQLLAGAAPFTAGVNLAGDFKTFAGLIKQQLGAISDSLLQLAEAAYKAEKTFNNAEDDALTAAQMFTILGGSPSGPSGGPPAGPPSV